MDECCAVCAEPLEWTAYSECGHTDTCSKCVARLRFVLGENRCPICQQDWSILYFTRYMGDYTARIGPNQFRELEGRAKRGEISYLRNIDGYFDDKDHFETIKELCDFTHPVLAEDEDAPPPFKSLNQLRNYIEKTFKKHFCRICLTGRKVFVSEQILYSRNALDRHLKSGDIDGDLAQAGFKGHPQCRFCRKRFYGDQELFQHNQSEHETCFICRRTNPDKYIYFRDYAELEEHFRKEHHPCPHPECLEQKFIVFGSEAELKRHFARIHKDETNMTRAEVREALTLEANFTIRRQRPEEQERVGAHSRAGVVIGGGGNVQSRLRRNRNSEPDMTRAIQNSLQTAREESGPGQAQRDGWTEEELTLNEADFPAIGGDGPSQTAGAATRWGGGIPGQNASLRPQDFPALPGQPANTNKKTKNKKSMANRIAGGQVRVLNSGTPPPDPNLIPMTRTPGQVQTLTTGPGPRPSPSTRPSTRTPPREAPADAWPSLGGQPSAVQRTTAQPNWLGGGGSSRPPGGQGNAQPASHMRLGAQENGVGPKPTLNKKDFPSLGGGAKKPTPAAANWKAKTQTKQQASPAKQKPKQAVPTPADFPSLPPGSTSTAPVARNWGGHNKRVIKISGALEAMTKALMKQLKSQLGDDYEIFRNESAEFLKGRIPADAYHNRMVQLGVAHLAAEVTTLCPDSAKREELMNVHRRFVQQAVQDPTNAQVFVPVDVLQASLDKAEKRTVWDCPKCSTVNCPQSDFCEFCDTKRPDKRGTQGGSRSDYNRAGGYEFGASSLRACNNGNDLFGARVNKKGNNAWSNSRRK